MELLPMTAQHWLIWWMMIMTLYHHCKLSQQFELGLFFFPRCSKSKKLHQLRMSLNISRIHLIELLSLYSLLLSSSSCGHYNSNQRRQSFVQSSFFEGFQFLINHRMMINVINSGLIWKFRRSISIGALTTNWMQSNWTGY